MKTICIFLAEGFEEMEAMFPLDVMRRGGLNVKTVSVTGEKTVVSSHQVPIVADMLFEDLKEEDVEMVVLPGGLPGATNLDAHAGLDKLIMSFAAAGKPLAAICAAPMVYGKRGLLKGKKATCYPGFAQYLEGAECTGAPVERDGKHNGHNRSRRSHQITIGGNCTEIREYVVCHKKQDSPGNTS